MSNNKQTTEPMVISKTSSTHTAQGIYVEHLKKDKTMSNNKQGSKKDLAYWKNNAEENYITTPISVLKYIYKLEEHIETIKAQLASDEEIHKQAINYTGFENEFKAGAKWMRDKIQGGNK